MVLLPTLGMSMLSSEKNGLLKNALKNMLKVPWLYAFIISWIIGALGFNWREDLPLPLFNYVEMLNRSAIPVILLLVGINLSKVPLKLKSLKQILPASLLKLFLPPAIALVVGKLIGMEGLVYQVFVLEIAMPTAANTAILAEGISDSDRREKELEFSSAVIVYSTFLFLFTYPIWFSIML
jgi:predicted permease